MSREYSDEEVRLILGRALEPVTDGEGAEGSGDGVSLEQIKDVGREVGIDPARIESAARSLGQREPVGKNPLLGSSTTINLQTTLAGHELSEDERRAALGEIRAALGRRGIVDSEFGSLEWRASDPFGGRYVSIVPSNEGTHVRVLGNFRDGAFLTFGAVGAAGIALASVAFGGWTSGPLIPLVGLVAAAAASVIPARLTYRWWRKREDARLRRAYDRVVALLGDRPRLRTSATEDDEVERTMPPDPSHPRQIP